MILREFYYSLRTLLRRFAAFLTSILGSAALLLSVVGLYGLMSHIVTHRAQEIGIRMALGAQLGDVLKLVVKQDMGLIAIGLVAGIIAALVLTRLVVSLLFGVSPTDLVTFTAVAMMLVIVGLLACYFPARRAMKVNPIEVVRCE
jgi:ABC-type antimicrobial peptide transport system permease subunit